MWIESLHDGFLDIHYKIKKNTDSFPLKIQICLPFFSSNLYFYCTSVIFYLNIILLKLNGFFLTILSYFYAIKICIDIFKFKINTSIKLEIFKIFLGLVMNTNNLNIFIINALRQHRVWLITRILESDCLDSKPSFSQLCSLGKVSWPFCASIASTVKWGKNNI